MDFFSPPGGTSSWGSRVWDFRLVKGPQAWKNRTLSKIQSAYSRPGNTSIQRNTIDLEKVAVHWATMTTPSIPYNTILQIYLFKILALSTYCHYFIMVFLYLVVNFAWSEDVWYYFYLIKCFSGWWVAGSTPHPQPGGDEVICDRGFLPLAFLPVDTAR